MSFVVRFWIMVTAFGVMALVMAPVNGEVVPPGSDAEIRKRLQPFGSLCRIGDDCGGAGTSLTAGSEALSGKGVYDKFCFACHATGVSEAPLLGDVDAWAPRIAKGLDVLWESTNNGLEAMPMRGTCMNCSDDELREAMEYLIGQAP